MAADRRCLGARCKMAWLMPLSIVAIQPDGRWPSHELDLRPIKDPHNHRLAILMLGAGFSKANNAKSPTWSELVTDVAARMKIAIGW